MNDRQDDVFWRDLDHVGEDAVREQLLRGMYGGRQRRLAEAWLGRAEETRATTERTREGHFRSREVNAAMRAARSARHSAIFAGLASVAAFGSVLVAWMTYARSGRETLDLSMQALRGGYASRVSGRIMPGYGGLLATMWECTIVNNGERTASVLSLDAKLVTGRGLVGYSGLEGGVVLPNGSTVEFPMAIEAGQSRRVRVRLRLPLDSTASATVVRLFPDSTIPELRRAADGLAAAKIDPWGNAVQPMFDGRRQVGFTMRAMDKQPIVMLTVSTGRQTVSTLATWYPGNGRESR